MGAQIKNQNYNNQVKQEGKNKKNEKKSHSIQRVYKKKCLLSNIEHSKSLNLKPFKRKME